MSATQLDLLSPAPLPKDAPSGRQHRLILAALYAERDRGLTGEEAAQRCGIRLTTTATTRLKEMSDDGNRDLFPVPLTCKTERRRSTASGKTATVWALTDYGREVAKNMAEAS